MIEDLGRLLREDSGKNREAETLSSARPPRSKISWRRKLLWTAAGIVFGAAASGASVWFWLRPAPPAPRPLMRFLADLPPNTRLAARGDPLAFSPDGSRLVIAAESAGGTRLYSRDLDKLEITLLEGTAGAYDPFFSPDGEQIGYFDSTDSSLKRIPVRGGRAVRLAEARFGLGACWTADGKIIFTPDMFSGMWTVSLEGGEAQPLTKPGSKEVSHGWPALLPGGRDLLFTVTAAGGGTSNRIEALSLETGARKVLIENAAFARYVPTGHICFLRDGDLFAAPFDAKRVELLGPPFPLVERLKCDDSVRAPQFAFSRVGTAVYAEAGPDRNLRSLIWVGREGRAEKVTVNSGAFSFPRVSPDGRLVAVAVYTAQGKSDIWLVDVEHGTFTRLTSKGNNLFPVWTPDGKRLTFASDLEGQWNLYWIPIDGSAPAELLSKGDHPRIPSCWSPDGKVLSFTEFDPETGADIWMLQVNRRGRELSRAEPFLRTRAREWGAVFSPDGRWLAYCSDQSGPDQVYVRRFEGGKEAWQISTAEGREPVWSPDGGEVFYRYWRGLMGVAVRWEPDFVPDAPRLVIQGRFDEADVPVSSNYDISPDGKRFLLIYGDRPGVTRLQVVANWFEELRRRASANPIAAP